MVRLSGAGHGGAEWDSARRQFCQELGRPAEVNASAGVGRGHSSDEAGNDRRAKGPYIERANQTTRKADWWKHLLQKIRMMGTTRNVGETSHVERCARRENSSEPHLSMESRMREIRTSGLTRGRTSAVIGLASHPVAFSLLYRQIILIFPTPTSFPACPPLVAFSGPVPMNPPAA